MGFDRPYFVAQIKLDPSQNLENFSKYYYSLNLSLNHYSVNYIGYMALYAD